MGIKMHIASLGGPIGHLQCLSIAPILARAMDQSFPSIHHYYSSSTNPLTLTFQCSKCSLLLSLWENMKKVDTTTTNGMQLLWVCCMARVDGGATAHTHPNMLSGDTCPHWPPPLVFNTSNPSAILYMSTWKQAHWVQWAFSQVHEDRMKFTALTVQSYACLIREGPLGLMVLTPW